jgi:pSer/pThr/pTyr-binding forkhead associated (FHA) protein
VSLPGRIVLGRTAQAEEPSLDLGDARISRRHALIERVATGPRLCDLGSRNGGFVDGAPLASGASIDLTDGTVVRLGDTLMVFRDGPAPPSEDDEVAAAFPGGSVDACDVRRRLRRLRLTRGHVLVQGETGTGKERAARALAAPGWALVEVNCA